MVVPGIANTDDWERIAQEQQEQLQDDTMSAIARGDTGDGTIY